MKFKKIASTLIFLLLTAPLFAQSANSILQAKWYTKTLSVHEGDNFKVNLFIYPDESQPIVTVSNTLVYNPKFLDFQDSEFPSGWMMIPNAPYYLTDKTLGMIRRTAGFSNGINEPAQYVTYNFKALHAGKTTISIEDGFALDAENTDIGFQGKSMTINVLPPLTQTLLPQFNDKESASSTTDALTDETYADMFKEKSINITMDTIARTALYEGDDYTATINLKQLPISNDTGEVDITMYDENNSIVYSKVELFQPGEMKKEIVIPATAFQEGNYVLNLKTSYKKTGTEIETNKEIGVLKKPSINIPGFVVHYFNYLTGLIGLLILILLFHIHQDHAVIREMKARYKKAFRRF